MGDEALIPLRLFNDRTVSVSTVANIVIGMGMFGGISVLPLYLQIVKGSSPTVAGLQLLPLTIQNAVSPRDIGVATASATFFRQIGGTLGVAVFLSILFSTLPDKLTAAF